MPNTSDPDNSAAWLTAPHAQLEVADAPYTPARR